MHRLAETTVSVNTIYRSALSVFPSLSALSAHSGKFLSAGVGGLTGPAPVCASFCTKLIKLMKRAGMQEQQELTLTGDDTSLPQVPVMHYAECQRCTAGKRCFCTFDQNCIKLLKLLNAVQTTFGGP